ncbi:MAG: hypothetical protein ACR2P7_02650 [bacterium]
MLFALALTAPAAHAASEICFDNSNVGATVNYYVYNKDVPNFTPRNNIWEWKTEVSAEPMRCVSVNDLRIVKPGDFVVGGYQVEAKYFGKHTFTCPGDARVTPSRLQRVVFRITGKTIWDTKCQREVVTSGEFLHNDKAIVKASRICFDNANHGTLVNYFLHAEQSEVWSFIREQALEPERCVNIADLDGVHQGAEMSAVIGFTVQGVKSKKCPSTVIADRNSKNKVKFTATGHVIWAMKCERTNHIHK